MLRSAPAARDAAGGSLGGALHRREAGIPSDIALVVDALLVYPQTPWFACLAVSKVRRTRVECACPRPLAGPILRCHGTFAQKRLHTLARKRVGLFVVDVTRVALEPMPGDLVARLGH